jgi:hypothetical protein
VNVNGNTQPYPALDQPPKDGALHTMLIASLLNPPSPPKTSHSSDVSTARSEPDALAKSTSRFSPVGFGDDDVDVKFWMDVDPIPQAGEVPVETQSVASDTTSTKGDLEVPKMEEKIISPPNALSALKREKIVKVESSLLWRGQKRGINSVDGSEPQVVGKLSRSVGGLSWSAIWERLQNETKEPLMEKSKQFDEYKLQILALDKYAEIQDAKNVRHLKCGKILVMKYNYSTNNFKTHIGICTGPPKSAKLPGGGMQSLSIAFQKQTKAVISSASGITPKSPPCPGLAGDDNFKILGYLNRTGAQGGGASSVTVISQQLYGKRFIKLSTCRRAQVKLTQKHKWLWRNDQDLERVYSVDCQKVASVVQLQPAPCHKCRALLQKKRFQNALNVSQPLDQNYKYVNHEYRNKKLAILFGLSTDLCPLIEGDVRVLFMFSNLTCHSLLAVALEYN